ncbi:aspartyl-phosphate phosphatase Spo0E family protein [Haloimpatiens sp. FM7315]
MKELIKQIEYTRAKLNKLIVAKEIITNDEELLKVSIELDELLNKYYRI